VVTIGFIVEGDSEKILIESESFKSWTKQQGITICHPVLNAKGGGNLLPENIEPLIKRLQSENPTHIIILTDLERESNQQAVKNRIGTQYTNLIFIAVKAIESWFLADSIALSNWLLESKKANLEQYVYCEIFPEQTKTMPWDYFQELAEKFNRKGRGSCKPKLAKIIIEMCGFELVRAANHPHCPSAKEFHDGLIALAK
jgi:hypothetical protein